MARSSFFFSFFAVAAAACALSTPLGAADWPTLAKFASVKSAEPSGAKVPPADPAWPKIPLGTLPPVPSPFAFETGARYWYSSGTVNFGFANGLAGSGDPTSTIDWKQTTGHTGELFGRLDYRPTGLFVKGLIGGGILSGGSMDDRDFFNGQVKFSDTSSGISGDGLTYGIIDFGGSYSVPHAGVRLSAFVGYHYWHEKLAARGLRCNPDDVGGAFCGAPGEWVQGTNIEVMTYEPTWNALRVGADAQIRFLGRWSLSAELVGIPYAQLHNADSHLLRGDLGPVPNVIDKSAAGYGAETEMFVNYALTPKIEVGAGLRYWGLFASSGTVQFGPSFSSSYPLRTFSEQRYGVLLQVKGTF